MSKFRVAIIVNFFLNIRIFLHITKLESLNNTHASPLSVTQDKPWHTPEVVRVIRYQKKHHVQFRNFKLNLTWNKEFNKTLLFLAR